MQEGKGRENRGVCSGALWSAAIGGPPSPRLGKSFSRFPIMLGKKEERGKSG